MGLNKNRYRWGKNAHQTMEGFESQVPMYDRMVGVEVEASLDEPHKILGVVDFPFHMERLEEEYVLHY
jgi:hypothetical protein